MNNNLDDLSGDALRDELIARWVDVREAKDFRPSNPEESAGKTLWIEKINSGGMAVWFVSWIDHEEWADEIQRLLRKARGVVLDERASGSFGSIDIPLDL